MHHRTPWFLGIIILLLFFIFFMPSIGMHLRGLMGPQGEAPSNVQQLAAENESLKAQIAEFDTIEGELPTSTPNTIRAMVYSRYPLNFKNEMVVNVGTDDKITVGSAVIFQGNLIGFVKESSPQSSVIQTIFDPNYKLLVRIGSNGYDALLVGGSYPMVESIAKTANISVGDIVYGADPSAPYAIPVGEIANVALASNNLFEEASLSFPYDIGMIQTVEITQSNSQ